MYAWLPYILSTLAVVAGMAFWATDFQLVPAFSVPCRVVSGLRWRVLGHAGRAGHPHAMLCLSALRCKGGRGGHEIQRVAKLPVPASFELFAIP